MSTAPAPRLPDAQVAPRLKSAMGRWQELVHAADAVDPVTTELVRLRAARHHDCHT